MSARGSEPQHNHEMVVVVVVVVVVVLSGEMIMHDTDCLL